jgi:hypothetical protein
VFCEADLANLFFFIAHFTHNLKFRVSEYFHEFFVYEANTHLFSKQLLHEMLSICLHGFVYLLSTSI